MLNYDKYIKINMLLCFGGSKVFVTSCLNIKLGEK